MCVDRIILERRHFGLTMSVVNPSKIIKKNAFFVFYVGINACLSDSSRNNTPNVTLSKYHYLCPTVIQLKIFKASGYEIGLVADKLRSKASMRRTLSKDLDEC